VAEVDIGNEKEILKSDLRCAPSPTAKKNVSEDDNCLDLVGGFSDIGYPQAA
jgi:hypothetical protein